MKSVTVTMLWWLPSEQIIPFDNYDTTLWDTIFSDEWNDLVALWLSSIFYIYARRPVVLPIWSKFRGSLVDCFLLMQLLGCSKPHSAEKEILLSGSSSQHLPIMPGKLPARLVWLKSVGSWPVATFHSIVCDESFSNGSFEVPSWYIRVPKANTSPSLDFIGTVGNEATSCCAISGL